MRYETPPHVSSPAGGRHRRPSGRPWPSDVEAGYVVDPRVVEPKPRCELADGSYQAVSTAHASVILTARTAPAPAVRSKPDDDHPYHLVGLRTLRETHQGSPPQLSCQVLTFEVESRSAQLSEADAGVAAQVACWYDQPLPGDSRWTYEVRSRSCPVRRPVQVPRTTVRRYD